MQPVFLSLIPRDTSTLYGGGALLFGGAAVVFFIVALFAKRAKVAGESLRDTARIMGPASTRAAGVAASGAAVGTTLARIEAPEESVVQIDEDDPRMTAAILEAKRRLTE